MKKYALTALSLAAFLVVLSHPVNATDTTAPALPAGLGGSVDLRGGSEHGNGSGLLSGSVDAPVTHSTGVQFDGTVGAIGGTSFESFGAHAFYRDPSQFLFGPAFQRSWIDNFAYNRYGAEGEYYYNDKFTFAGRLGYQDGDAHEGEYTQLDLNWYLDDNLAVTPGLRNSVDHDWARVAVECEPKVIRQAPGLSLFASTGAGNYGYAFGLIGVKYYFDGDKSLQGHHREDGVVDIAPDEILSNATISSTHQR